jgi:hypothetical protein
MMIRNDVECKAAVAQLAQVRRQLAERRDQLKVSESEDALVDPTIEQLRSRRWALEEEIATYHRRTAQTWRFSP